MVAIKHPAMSFGSAADHAHALLMTGLIAGPLYVGVSAVEAFVRDGFDITRHSLSLLANGDLGWVHMTMMVAAGLFTVAGAIGIAASMSDDRKNRWAAELIAVFGLGIIASGLMPADPADGFPAGTPAGTPETMTAMGTAHFVAAGVGILALVAACTLMWRSFTASGDRNWALFSLATGGIYLGAAVAVFASDGARDAMIAFAVAVVLGWTWLTLMFRRSMEG